MLGILILTSNILVNHLPVYDKSGNKYIGEEVPIG
jgi:hypothetical protein